MTTRTYSVGDRVVVPPHTQFLHHEALGGPGTIVETVDEGKRGQKLTIALDCGGLREPFADFVKPEDTGE